MKLIPTSIANTLPKMGETAELSAENITIHVKLFALASAATWLVAEYDAENNLIFCYADLYGQGVAGGAEWGYTSLEELESLTWMGIQRVERDVHFKPRLFPECVDADGRITA